MSVHDSSQPAVSRVKLLDKARSVYVAAMNSFLPQAPDWIARQRADVVRINFGRVFPPDRALGELAVQSLWVQPVQAPTTASPSNVVSFRKAEDELLRAHPLQGGIYRHLYPDAIDFAYGEVHVDGTKTGIDGHNALGESSPEVTQRLLSFMGSLIAYIDAGHCRDERDTAQVDGIFTTHLITPIPSLDLVLGDDVPDEFVAMVRENLE